MSWREETERTQAVRAENAPDAGALPVWNVLGLTAVNGTVTMPVALFNRTVALARLLPSEEPA